MPINPCVGRVSSSVRASYDPVHIAWLRKVGNNWYSQGWAASAGTFAVAGVGFAIFGVAVR